MKRLVFVLVLVLLATACACRDRSRPGRDVVALIDGEPVMRAEMELYFQVNLLSPPEPDSEPMEGPPDKAELNRVKSRLFDEFLKEESLLAEARRRAIRVSDEEVETYIGLGRVEGTGVTELTHESRRRLARRRLLIEKLHENIYGQIEPPSKEEVASFAAQNPWLSPGKHVVIRVLLLDSEETARKIHSDIRRDRTTFADAAIEYQSQPGQAAPQTVDWASLPEEVRLGLEGLKPGQVSAPLDHDGLFYLFQIQAWLEDDGWSERERFRAARKELLRKKGLEATVALMHEMRETSEVRLQTQHLGFRYVPENES